MNTYMLYGTKLIKKDDTLKDFTLSVMENISEECSNSYEFVDRDAFLELVWDSLENDISRTDINYQELMHKYRDELGNLLYEFENNNIEIGDITFFGESAWDSFNKLVYNYIKLLQLEND